MEIKASSKQGTIERAFLFIWLLIIVPKSFAMVATVLLSIFLWYKQKGRPKTVIYTLLFSLGVVQLFAIAASIFYLPVNLERIAAAINTACLWLCAAGIFETFRSKYISLAKVGKYCLINIGILALLSLIAFLQYRFNFLTFLPTMHITDWINGKATFRLLCLMDYSNCIPIFVMLCLPFSLIYLKQRFATHFALPSLLLLVVSAIIIYFSNSRISILTFLFYLLLYVAVYLRHRTNVFGILLSLAIAGAVIVVLLCHPLIIGLFRNVLESRSGSNSMRFQIYANSILTAMKYNPLFGVGVKVMFSGYPLGSHSTLVGAFYKTGIVGLLLLLSIPFVAIRNRVKNGDKIVGLALFSLSIVFLFEDIDGANWIPLLFFALLGTTQKGKASTLRQLFYLFTKGQYYDKPLRSCPSFYL